MMRICAYCNTLHDERITVRVSDEGPRPMYFCSWRHLEIYASIRTHGESLPTITKGNPS